MSLSSKRESFESDMIALWSRDPIPEDTSLTEIEPIFRSFWNSASVDGYSVLTCSCDYSEFYVYIDMMMSGEIAASTIEEGAENLESLLRKIPTKTVFNSSDSDVEFVRVRASQSGKAVVGSLKGILVPLLQSGVDGEPKLEEIISAFADFFLGWEVELDDEGSRVTASII